MAIQSRLKALCGPILSSRRKSGMRAPSRGRTGSGISGSSCCIDKSSSSELSEAINSMYAGASVCYAYLADVPADVEDHWERGSSFRASLWFTRGWTLQELLAPVNVIFLSEDWRAIGWKDHLITGIHREALLHERSLDEFSVAQLLSWTSERETTREEDRAYSLLGIFDISMPTLYGEGERAFRRLQEEIILRVPDQTLFAWGTVYDGPDILPPATAFRCSFDTTTSLLASDLSEFREGGRIRIVSRGRFIRLLDISRNSPATEYIFSPYAACSSLFFLSPIIFPSVQ